MNDKIAWVKTRLGDVIDNIIVYNTRFPDENFERIVGLDNMESGSFHIPVVMVQNPATSFTKVFRTGQTLFGKRRAYQKKIAIAEFDGLCSGDILVLDSKDENRLLSLLIPFICASNSFYNFVIGNSQGSLSPRISFKALQNFEFLLPPIEEQKKIAEVLWAADNVLQHYSQCQKDLYGLKSLLMDDLGRTLHSSIPNTLLGNVIEYKSGQVDPKEEPYKSMPLVAPNHVQSDTGKIINIETAGEQNAISGKYVFEIGDVVYSKIRPTLNKVFIASFGGLCSADMYPIKPSNKKLVSEFLYYILKSKQFIEYATICSVRTSIPKLNRADMSKYKFACPEIKYQHEFLKKMNACEASIDAISSQIAHSQSVLSTLISNMLGGAH